MIIINNNNNFNNNVLYCIKNTKVKIKINTTVIYKHTLFHTHT